MSVFSLACQSLPLSSLQASITIIDGGWAEGSREKSNYRKQKKKHEKVLGGMRVEVNWGWK